MQFHEPRSVTKWYADRGLRLDDFMGHVDPTPRQEMERIAAIEIMTDERHFREYGRPFYNIWPSMLDPLLGINLGDLTVGDVQWPVDVLCLRFPVQAECFLRTVLMVRGPLAGGALRIRVDVGDLGAEGYPRTVSCEFRDDQTLPNTLSDFMGQMSVTQTSDPLRQTSEQRAAEMTWSGIRVLLAVGLLRENPDVIVPKPLAADAWKFEQTGDMALIEKAKKRGCFQFDVGRDLVLAPGVRRPHFARRWMGHRGEQKAVIRPIRGSIVQRKVVQSVPMGYMDVVPGETDHQV